MGEGCSTQLNAKNLSEVWKNTTITPDSKFTDYQPTVSSVGVNFFPVDRKGANYLRYCTGWLGQNEKPASIKDCVRRYTSESGWFCSTINFALTTDSPDLQSYSEYIKHLKYSIGMSPMNFTGTVYRGEYKSSKTCNVFEIIEIMAFSLVGVDLSLKEVAAYESKQRLFIPSFTSTSTSITRAFKKNTIFHIEISPQWSKFCMEITSEFTEYPGEAEVLFSCYNVYQYHRTENCSGGTRIIKLSLMDYEKNFNYRTNLFVP